MLFLIKAGTPELPAFSYKPVTALLQLEKIEVNIAKSFEDTQDFDNASTACVFQVRKGLKAFND